MPIAEANAASKIESSLPAWPGNYDNRARAKGETKSDRSAITSFAQVINLYEALASTASMVATPVVINLQVYMGRTIGIGHTV